MEMETDQAWTPDMELAVLHIVRGGEFNIVRQRATVWYDPDDHDEGSTDVETIKVVLIDGLRMSMPVPMTELGNGHMMPSVGAALMLLGTGCVMQEQVDDRRLIRSWAEFSADD